MRPRFATVVMLVVVVHLAVNFAHGWAHLMIPVLNSFGQNLFIVPVIGIAPLLAAGLVLRGRTRAGALLLAASMLGALAFGIAYHYVIRSPDHVSHVPATLAGSVFRGSAFGLALVELAGVAIGVWGVIRAPSPGVTRS